VTISPLLSQNNCTRGDAAPSEVYKVVEMSRHLSVFDDSAHLRASKRAFINSNSGSSAYTRRNIPASLFTRGP
jgi:hypothetical protein